MSNVSKLDALLHKTHIQVIKVAHQMWRDHPFSQRISSFPLKGKLKDIVPFPNKMSNDSNDSVINSGVGYCP